jgi:hypothetical protein
MQTKITDIVDKKDGQLLDRESDLAAGQLYPQHGVVPSTILLGAAATLFITSI